MINIKEKKTGCLLIHGFAGTTDEIVRLEKTLKEKGYDVEMPCLKGHTGCRADFKGVKHGDWTDSVRDCYKELKNRCEKVAVIGFSMGGLIGARLIPEYGADAFITVNTPIYYLDFKNIVKNIFWDFKNNSKEHIRRYLFDSRKATIGSLFQFQLFVKTSKKMLKEVRCPAMFMQALDDDTVVARKSVSFLRNNISSEEKKMKFYPRGGHQIFNSFMGHNVISDIVDYLDNKGL